MKAAPLHSDHTRVYVTVKLKITGTKIRGNLSSDETFVEIETMIIVRDRDWQMKKNVSR